MRERNRVMHLRRELENRERELCLGQGALTLSVQLILDDIVWTDAIS